jgi:hypothetical protein
MIIISASCNVWVGRLVAQVQVAERRWGGLDCFESSAACAFHSPCQNYYRDNDHHLTFQTSMFWASIQGIVSERVSSTRMNELDAMFYRGSFDKELANQVKCKNEDFELKHLSFMQVQDAGDEVGAGGVEKVTAVEFQLFKMQLLSEQTRFQTYAAQLRDWTTQSQQSQHQYHETVFKLRSTAVDEHCSQAYRVVLSLATKEVEAQVNTCIAEAADATI